MPRPQFIGKRELTRQLGIGLLLPKNGHLLSRKCRARSNWPNVEIDVFNDLPARAICELAVFDSRKACLREFFSSEGSSCFEPYA